MMRGAGCVQVRSPPVPCVSVLELLLGQGTGLRAQEVMLSGGGRASKKKAQVYPLHKPASPVWKKMWRLPWCLSHHGHLRTSSGSLSSLKVARIVCLSCGGVGPC